MSASIHYHQTNKGNLLSVGSSSQFLECMERAFGASGESSWILGPEHLQTLRGMAAANPFLFSELVKIVEELYEVRVWATW